MRTSAAGQRGFALLIVLWTLVLITLLATQLTGAGRFETQLAGNLRQAARLQALADGEVHDAIFHLMDPGPGGWRADGQVRTVALPGVVAEIRIADEAGKVNPSNATPELLASLLRQEGAESGAATAIAAAIVQWRTPSGNAATSGPRFDAYRAAGRAYGPSGAPFVSFEELGAVIGMTPDMLARLVPHLTLYTDEDPDPELADPAVRAALAATSGTQPGNPQARAVRVLAILVTLSGADGAGFTRRAIVKLTSNDRRQDYRILTWEAPAA